MEIEHINNHMIHVIIGNDDLNERGLSLMELLGDHDEIESFFYGILDEIDTNDDFKDSEQVTFQVLPRRNGVELFITRDDGDESASEIFGNIGNFQKQEPVDSDIRRQLMETDRLTNKNQTIIDGVSKVENWSIFKLKHFDSMIHLSHKIKAKNLFSDFYSYKGDLFLVLRFDFSKISEDEIKNINSIASEFGSHLSVKEVTPMRLDSQGKLLMENRALQISQTYFKS